MRRPQPVVLTAIAALTLACHDSTGPAAPDYSGTWVADSIYCRDSWDTGTEILPLGASLTLVLKADSTIGGRLFIPAAWMPDGWPAENDTLIGSWQQTPAGFHMDGPWGTLLYNVAFTVKADTARATIQVKNFPLDLFAYGFRLHRQ
jgi:hypothetical protein